MKLLERLGRVWVNRDVSSLPRTPRRKAIAVAADLISEAIDVLELVHDGLTAFRCSHCSGRREGPHERGCVQRADTFHEKGGRGG